MHVRNGKRCACSYSPSAAAPCPQAGLLYTTFDNPAELAKIAARWPGAQCLLRIRWAERGHGMSVLPANAIMPPFTCADTSVPCTSLVQRSEQQGVLVNCHAAELRYCSRMQVR